MAQGVHVSDLSPLSAPNQTKESRTHANLRQVQIILYGIIIILNVLYTEIITRKALTRYDFRFNCQDDHSFEFFFSLLQTG